MSDDLIRREDVLKWVCDSDLDLAARKAIANAVRALPAVTPEAGDLISEERIKYEQLCARISVGKASQQDAVDAIKQLCADNERLAVIAGKRRILAALELVADPVATPKAQPFDWTGGYADCHHTHVNELANGLQSCTSCGAVRSGALEPVAEPGRMAAEVAPALDPVQTAYDEMIDRRMDRMRPEVAPAHDPMQDPRVKALVEALGEAQYGLTWAKANLRDAGLENVPPVDRSLTKTSAALRQFGGEA